MLVLGFDEYADQGRRLAQRLALPYAGIDLHSFPDGESRVTLPPGLPDRVVICRTLNDPNQKLIELLLAAQTARRSGVVELMLVAPYLCYMRQDSAFHPGEAVSQQIIGQFLAGLFDAVITVDAHLHRISSLDQALSGIRAVNLSAAPLFVDFLKTRASGSLLVGPDSESAQWVEAIAGSLGCEFVIADKRRSGDRSVEIILPQRDYKGQRIVLVDDMISTGNTLIRIAEALYRRGVAGVDALATHALFDTSAARRMHQAGIGRIWSTDSVSHTSNALHLDPLLAAAVTEPS